MVKFGPIKKLGTIWWFEFFDLEEIYSDKVLFQIKKLMDDFENKYSRFRDDSYVSEINTKNIIKNPDLEFVDILNMSKLFYEKTDGVFNILVGGYLEMVGYDKEYNFSKKIEYIPEVPSLEDNLKISENKISLSKGAKIDLGGIGKGYLIDKLTRFFKDELNLESFLINGGGDIYSTQLDGKGFDVSLKNPEGDGVIGKVVLQNQGFAASSPSLRSWKGSDGKTYSHLVGSKKPKHTFVVADSATEADVWATAMSINPDIKLPNRTYGLKV